MACPDMHGDCGVVPERHATPAQVKMIKKHTDEHTSKVIASPGRWSSDIKKGGGGASPVWTFLKLNTLY